MDTTCHITEHLYQHNRLKSRNLLYLHYKSVSYSRVSLFYIDLLGVHVTVYTCVCVPESVSSVCMRASGVQHVCAEYSLKESRTAELGRL